MKDGIVLKSATRESIKNDDMELINSYSIKELKADDVMIFKVLLCDNEIDRDFECFTEDSLVMLSKLFVGKSGIVDHNLKSDSQLARIFKAEVENLSPKKNSQGEDYLRLVAKAYIVKNAQNSSLISDIESGIKKEVSVNCSVEKKLCSICGKATGSCRHAPGAHYSIGGENVLCYSRLVGAYDAYEWSFVAVPAQKNAGVIKSYGTKTQGKSSRSAEELLSKLQKGFCINLSREEARTVYEHIESLRYLSEKGMTYEESLKKNFIKTAFEALPDISEKALAGVSEKMNIDELKDFTYALCRSMEKKKSIMPQTMPITNNSSNTSNVQFKI